MRMCKSKRPGNVMPVVSPYYKLNGKRSAFLHNTDIWMRHSQQMIRHNILRYVKPKCTGEIQYLSFIRHLCKHAVKARLPVSSNKCKFGSEIITIAYFAREARWSNSFGGVKGDIITSYLKRCIIA